MNEKTMSLKKFRKKYKKKWSGLILKEVCNECGSENILICNDGEPPEIYPLSRCLDCKNEMYHNHICWICGKDGEDGLVCLKCSKKYTLEEINELIKNRKDEKINDKNV